jgi:uncharacterized membrane protein
MKQLNSLQLFIYRLGGVLIIIGAMLISPLMGPIIGMGFAMGTMYIDMLATISEILRPFPKKDYLCASHSCLIFSRNKLTSIYIE